jgi:phage/plasmid-like protein (TIGR03299 family)
MMAHNISQRNGQAAVMVVGGPAWHRLGTVLHKPATAEQAIKAAHLDWTVIKQPLFAGEKEYHRVPDYYAVVRGDDWSKGESTVLGIVRREYTPLQNREAFKFFDPIVGAKAAIYHTAGALGDGERIWILARLPDDIRVIGDDITQKYLLLSNSHDGNSAVQIKFTPIRVVCQNTLTMALNQGPTLRVPHTKDVRRRLMIAATMLNAIKVRYSELEGTFKGMAAYQVNGDKLQQYLLQVFPDPRRREDDARYERTLAQARTDRAGAEYLFDLGRGNREKGVAGTLWAAYNGVAEYVDYRKYEKATNDRQVEAIWFGDGYSIKARAYTVAEHALRATAN